jgi:hypothetical protein
MMNETTYPKAKLAEIKKRGAAAIASDLLKDMKIRSGDYEDMPLLASRLASSQVLSMKTRALYSFLKDNGYEFDAARARWISTAPSTGSASAGGEGS